VLIYTIGLGSEVDADGLQAIAGARDRYFFAPSPEALFPIYGQILRQVLSSLAGNLIIDDEMAADIDYLPDSAHPKPIVAGSRLTWGRSILPKAGITMSYRILPRAAGWLPTNRQAVADYTDADGIRRRFTFPVPTIHVITPTPTATPTPTVTPTPTPVPLPMYLPFLVREHCLPGVAHADVVLLLDVSSSMEGAKLVEAKRAARTFVGLLDLPEDQAALIAFSETARLEQGLTGDRGRLERVIDGLALRLGTRIDRALEAAERELAGGRRRLANRPVVVLLSDGDQVGPLEPVHLAAGRLKGRGVRLFTVGLGAGANEGLLRAVASPGGYRFAAQASELEAVYRTVARVLPCR
jgi:hypothetical protein